MKFLSKYSEYIILGITLLGFIIGAGLFLAQWKINRSNWQTNFDEYSLDPDAVNFGGLGRDGRIRPIDTPQFASVMNAASEIAADTPVIVVDYYGAERAYPLHIMAAHEIVNDQIRSIPIAVTFCPLCNSAIVYDRRINGATLRLGVSGNLYGNNFLMYDDLTESWWYQFTGEAVVGDYTGETLDIIPSQIFGFGAFAARYPDGDVLMGDAERPNINYGLSPYPGYENGQPLRNADTYDLRLDPMQRVLASTIGDVPIAYSFATLQDVGVINDTINEQPIVAMWQPGVVGALSVADENAQDVGHAALYGRVVDGEILTFRYENGRIFDNQTNSEWNIFGEAIAGDFAGRYLVDYDCFSHFWFAWSSAYPQTLLYSTD